MNKVQWRDAFQWANTAICGARFCHGNKTEKWEPKEIILAFPLRYHVIVSAWAQRKCNSHWQIRLTSLFTCQATDEPAQLAQLNKALTN